MTGRWKETNVHVVVHSAWEAIRQISVAPNNLLIDPRLCLKSIDSEVMQIRRSGAKCLETYLPLSDQDCGFIHYQLDAVWSEQIKQSRNVPPFNNKNLVCAAYRFCFGPAPVDKLVPANSLLCRNLELTITIRLRTKWALFKWSHGNPEDIQLICLGRSQAHIRIWHYKLVIYFIARLPSPILIYFTLSYLMWRETRGCNIPELNLLCLNLFYNNYFVVTF